VERRRDIHHTTTREERCERKEGGVGWGGLGDPPSLFEVIQEEESQEEVTKMIGCKHHLMASRVDRSLREHHSSIVDQSVERESELMEFLGG
jgi:hypothetical protein